MKDWDDLRFFQAVAESGSLNAASRALGVNHSTVFRRINALEERLEAVLFDRLENRYQLTDAGRTVYRQAEQVADLINEIQLNVAGRDTRLTGVIRITSPETLARCFLSGAIAAFREQFPDILCEVSISPEDFNLARREADIALRATNQPPESLIGKKIDSIAWRFFGNAEFAERYRDEIEQDAPLLMPSGGLLRIEACQWLEKQQHRFRVVARCDDLPTLNALARRGLGIALLPDDASEGLHRVRETAKGFVTDVWLLTHPDLRKNARIQTCMRFLAECYNRQFRDRLSETLAVT